MHFYILGVWQSQCTESAAVVLGDRGNVVWRESKPSDPESPGWVPWMGGQVPASEVRSLVEAILQNAPCWPVQYVSIFWVKVLTKIYARNTCAVLRNHSLWNDGVWGNLETFQVHFNLWEANGAHAQKGIACITDARMEEGRELSLPSHSLA